MFNSDTGLYIPPFVIPLFVNKNNVLVSTFDRDEVFDLLEKIYKKTDCMRTKIFLEENPNTWTYGEYLVIIYNDEHSENDDQREEDKSEENSCEDEIKELTPEQIKELKESVKGKDIICSNTYVNKKISLEDQQKATFQTKNLRAKKN